MDDGIAHSDATMAYHLPACMRVLETAHVVEILREAGPGGLHVDAIAWRTPYAISPRTLCESLPLVLVVYMLSSLLCACLGLASCAARGSTNSNAILVFVRRSLFRGLRGVIWHERFTLNEYHFFPYTFRYSIKLGSASHWPFIRYMH
jgi:hypothetical protein